MMVRRPADKPHAVERDLPDQNSTAVRQNLLSRLRRCDVSSVAELPDGSVSVARPVEAVVIIAPMQRREPHGLMKETNEGRRPKRDGSRKGSADL
jgi:hypothetical protein